MSVGDTSLFNLLSDARPVLLNFSADPNSLAAQAQAMGIQVFDAKPGRGYEGLCAVLIRPDGYIWWATDDPAEPLGELGVHFQRGADRG